jgi:Tfp pilus assembly protein PilV
MATARRHPKAQRGVTLLEALISLAILLVGMLGLMQLQIFGITSDSGARAQTQALQLGRELAAALEKLEPDHALVAPHFTSADPPADFGRLLTADGSLADGGYRAWSDDTTALAGVTTDATLLASAGADSVDASLPRFQRRWSVWQSQSAATVGGVKLVAVSVTYRERTLPGLREVVLLTQVSNQGLVSSFASAYR